MQKLRTLSRSIINDPVHSKVTQKRFKNHQNTVKNPYAFSQHTSLKKTIDDEKNQDYALQISRFKKVRLNTYEKIDPVILQNRSLVKKMEDIDKRKSQSLVSFKVPRTSKHKIFTQKIKEENKYIFEKIKNERQNIKSKRDFKKQFAQVDKLIMHSRKIKQTIKKSKKDKKIINFKFPKQSKDFVFECQIKSNNPIPLLLR